MASVLFHRIGNDFTIVINRHNGIARTPPDTVRISWFPAEIALEQYPGIRLLKPCSFRTGCTAHAASIIYLIAYHDFMFGAACCVVKRAGNNGIDLVILDPRPDA